MQTRRPQSPGPRKNPGPYIPIQQYDDNAPTIFIFNSFSLVRASRILSPLFPVSPVLMISKKLNKKRSHNEKKTPLMAYQ